MENQQAPTSEETHLSADELVSNLMGLLETYLRVLKLEITSNTSAILALGVLVAVALFFGGFALFFFSICMAYVIHYIFDIHLLWGFLSVGFFYVLLLVVFARFRKKIQLLFERVLYGLLEK